MRSSAKIAIILIAVFGLLLVAEYFYYRYSLASQDKQIRQLYNQIAERDSLVEVSDGGYERLAIELQETQILARDLEQKRGRLASVLKKKDLKIRALTNMTLTPDTVRILIEAEETVSEGNGRKVRVDFDRRINRIHVWGYTETPPPVANLSILEDPLELYIILAQGKDKRWRSYVDSPVSVSELQTKIVPYSPSFWEQIGFKAGVGCGTGRLMGIAGLEYRKIDVLFFADNHGIAWGVTRAWRLR